MARLDPLQGEYYLRGGSVYRVILVKRAKDSVLVKDIATDINYEIELSLFRFGGYKRVWQTGAVADLLHRSPRSIYRYEQRGQIQKAKRYLGQGDKALRFYTKEDILEIQELIADIHGGRPRRDKMAVNNGVPSKRELLITFKERFGI